MVGVVVPEDPVTPETTPVTPDTTLEGSGTLLLPPEDPVAPLTVEQADESSAVGQVAALATPATKGATTSAPPAPIARRKAFAGRERLKADICPPPVSSWAPAF